MSDPSSGVSTDLSGNEIMIFQFNTATDITNIENSLDKVTYGGVDISVNYI